LLRQQTAVDGAKLNFFCGILAIPKDILQFEKRKGGHKKKTSPKNSPLLF
jgi:hypothetical protein